MAGLVKKTKLSALITGVEFSTLAQAMWAYELHQRTLRPTLIWLMGTLIYSLQFFMSFPSMINVFFFWLWQRTILIAKWLHYLHGI